MTKSDKLFLIASVLFIFCMIANPALGAPKEIFFVPFLFCVGSLLYK